MVRLLLTAGPTREALDAVRYISNASTGRQAVAIAEEALSRGWAVDLVHGPMECPPPPAAVAHPVTSAAEMLEACLRLYPGCDVLIGAAAVSDYRPSERLGTKRKRGEEPWVLRLVPTTDILAHLGERKGGRVHVGFALETDDLAGNALRKLRRKNLDCLVANPAEAVGSLESDYLLVLDDGTIRDLGRRTKAGLSRILCDEVARRLSARSPELD